MSCEYAVAEEDGKRIEAGILSNELIINIGEDKRTTPIKGTCVVLNSWLAYFDGHSVELYKLQD